MNPQQPRPLFYWFLSSQSFLIGLLPFYLPVQLFDLGLGARSLALLIALTGFGFLLSLGPWQWCARRWTLKRLVLFCTALQALLVLVLGALSTHEALTPLTGGTTNLAAQSWAGTLAWLVAVGLLSGASNAFFWTTQRSLFLQRLGDGQSGRAYGNLQIVVGVFLKLGILIGGLALASEWGLPLALGLAVGAALFTAVVIAGMTGLEAPLLAPTDQGSVIGLRQALGWRDQHHSMALFLLDGLYLFLESHFWTVALYTLFGDSFSQLGVVSVGLSVSFSVIFWLLRGSIDRLPANRIYAFATVLYGVSWLLRWLLPNTESNLLITIMLVSITFCSLYFRLAFNKRFFDIARRHPGIDYLVVKSQISQLAIVVGFALAALPLGWMARDAALQWAWLLALFLAPLYLIYRPQNA